MSVSLTATGNGDSATSWTHVGKYSAWESTVLCYLYVLTEPLM